MTVPLSPEQGQYQIDLESSARQAADDGDLQTAEQKYLELLATAPNWEHGLGCYEIALVYEEQGRVEEAIKFYNTAIDQRPHDDMFYQGLTMYLEKLGRYAETFEEDCRAINMSRPPFDEFFVAQLSRAAKQLGFSPTVFKNEVLARVPQFVEKHPDFSFQI